MGDVSGAGDRVFEGRLATPGGLRVGRLRFGERIEAVDVGRVAHEGDAGLPLVAPGFIDQHVHGGGGGDAMDGEDGVRALARHHLRYGTTTLFPTTLTAPWPRVLAALRGIAEVASAPAAAAAAVLGAPLAGPVGTPQRRGAQPLRERAARRGTQLAPRLATRIGNCVPLGHIGIEPDGGAGLQAAWALGGQRALQPPRPPHRTVRVHIPEPRQRSR